MREAMSFRMIRYANIHEETIMTVQEMLARLSELGFSQASIAEICGTTQSTLSRAATGTSVRYQVGRAIEALLEKVERAEKTKQQKAGKAA